MPEPAPRTISNSRAAFESSRQLLSGGVNSPVRAFAAVGGTPIFIREARGAWLTDIDGNTYIDYIGGYGPMIAGHADERVVAAVAQRLRRGTCFGTPTEIETQLAERIVSALPSVDMVRFVNSGTEAVMSAIRLARAFTSRDRVVKCIGCYHGHADGMLIEAGSGALTHGTPSSPGVPKFVAAGTAAVHFNDLEETRELFEALSGEIACLVVEPVAGNMGVVPPAEGYLAGLRKLCDDHGALLIFDEVMTGFRVAWGGAQILYDVRPDLTCLGKIIGGGLPVGAYAGRRELIQMISPAGPVYQAGTLSGNPATMAAGLATLDVLSEPGSYQKLDDLSARLAAGLQARADAMNVPICINRVGSMLTPFLLGRRGGRVTSYADAMRCDRNRFAMFFQELLCAGVHVPPSQFEAWFVSLAHSEDVIDQTLKRAERALAAVNKLQSA